MNSILEYTPRKWSQILEVWPSICGNDVGDDQAGIWIERGIALLDSISTWTVYCFGVPSGAKKVGMTNGPLNARISALQTGNHEKISIVTAMYVPEDGASEVERRVHSILADCRLHGEWFNCKTPDALAAMENAYAAFVRKWWKFYLQNVGIESANLFTPKWHAG